MSTTLQQTQTGIVKLDQVIGGIIPADLGAKGELLGFCDTAEMRVSHVRAAVIARARSENFADDPGGWVAWACAHLGSSKEQIHHLRNVGELLLGVHARVWHATLLQCDTEKLYAISRLPGQLLDPYMKKARPLEHTRDEVRAGVNKWLIAGGEPPLELPGTGGSSGRKKTPRAQPDFLDALFAAALDEDKRARYVRDAELPAHKAAISGLVLVDVAVRKYTASAGGGAADLADLEEILDELQRQEASVRGVLAESGRRLLTAAPAPAELEG